MGKIIRIPNCNECIYSYEKDEFGAVDKTYLICANMEIIKKIPKISDRKVSKTKIPKWCILEEDESESK